MYQRLQKFIPLLLMVVTAMSLLPGCKIVFDNDGKFHVSQEDVFIFNNLTRKRSCRFINP